MEISAYDVHHIVARYLGLRHCVYFVSDWLVFFCSFLCCQCAQYWIPESISDSSIATYEMVPRKIEADTKLSHGEPCKSQHIMIDFEQTETKSNIHTCTELWSLVDAQKELDGAILKNNFAPLKLTKLTDSPTTNKKQEYNECRDEYPAVHNVTTKPQEEHPTGSASFINKRI